MSLFSIFKRRDPQEDMITLLPPMKEMVSEAERIYRNMLKIYSEDFGSVQIAGKGLFKARLLGASYMTQAFASKWNNDHKQMLEFMNLAGGLAFAPFDEKKDPTYPALSRDESTALCSKFLIRAFKAISEELSDGPSQIFARTQGFTALLDLHHEALADSIGKAKYDRDRFDISLSAGIPTHLNFMARWIQAIK